MVSTVTGKSEVSERQVVLDRLFEAARDLSASTTVKEAIDALNTNLGRFGAANAAVWLDQDDRFQLVKECVTYRESYEGMAQEVVEFRASGAQSHRTGTSYFHRMQGPFGAFGVAVYDSGPAGFGEAGRKGVETLVSHGATTIQRAMLTEIALDAKVQAARDALQTALLSSLSHDFRTPIATIVASASLLQNDVEKLSADERWRVVQSIREEGERLNRYIEHLLGMVRLEYGALTPTIMSIEPREILESAGNRIKRRLDSRKIIMALPLSSCPIEADPILLEQSIFNAIENAVNYTPNGAEIVLGFTHSPTSTVLYVEDDGRGINPHDLDRIFEKFYQSSSDGGRRGGIGLGLSISQGLTRAMGGELRAISPVRNGKGTRIEFVFERND